MFRWVRQLFCRHEWQRAPVTIGDVEVGCFFYCEKCDRLEDATD